MGDMDYSTVERVTGSFADLFGEDSLLSWLYDRWGTSDSDIEIMNSALNPDADAVFYKMQNSAVDAKGYLINTQFISNTSPESQIENFLMAGEVAICYDYHENFSAEYAAGINQYFSVSDQGGPSVYFSAGTGTGETTIRADGAMAGVGGWLKYTVSYPGLEAAALADKYGWIPGASTMSYITTGFDALASSVASTALRSRFYYNTVKPVVSTISMDSLSIFSDTGSHSSVTEPLTALPLPMMPMPTTYT